VIVGQTAEQACVAGYYSLQGASYCEPCEAGHFGSSTAQSSCSDCPAGTFQNRTAQSACILCSAGSHSVTNRTLCALCPQGFVSELRSTNCTKCAAGMYTMGSGSTTCLSCDSNITVEGCSQQTSPGGESASVYTLSFYLRLARFWMRNQGLFFYVEAVTISLLLFASLMSATVRPL
jgi:hypothetical protein